MSKRVLLTGASGTVGFAALKMLVEEGRHEITVFDLETKKSRKLLRKYRSRVKLVFGDISNKEDVQKVSKDKDVVIHLAALIPPLADDMPELAYKVNVTGTKNLLESLEINSPDSFFAYSSSVATYGDRQSNPDIYTTDPLIPSVGDEYARTKIEAEQIIRESKLKWTIFRLSAIMGSNNHETGKLMFHMPLSTSMEIATPQDTARAFVYAIDHTTELNHTIFNLGGGDKCRIKYLDFISKSFDIVGLGELDFPENTFAERNFHCGHYADGDKLEEILHFRQDTMDDYFIKLEEDTTFFKKLVTRLFSKQIKKMLLSKSEPLNARANNNTQLIERFFN